MAENQGFLEGGMPLLVQYLAAAGQDIGSGNPIGTNVNAATQQNLKAQSMTKMLQKLLAGGGKMTMDSQNVNIKAPVGAFSGSGGSVTEPYTGEQLSAPTQSMTEPVTGQRLQQPSTSGQSSNMLKTMMAMNLLGGGAGNINPPSSPLGNITAADLVGLTPQDISQALGFKFSQDESIRRDQREQLADDYAMRKLGIEEQRLNKERQTADITNYQYAVSQGYKGSFDEFRNSTASAGIKDYEYAVRQGYRGTFQEWKAELAERARPQTNVNIIDRKVEEKKALAKLEGQLYFSNPKWTEDLNKVVNSEDVQNKLFAMPAAQRKEYEPKIKIKFIEDKITAGGGEVIGFNWADEDQKIIEWRVRWPSGDVETVRYGIRD